jgi:hypothetical protein
VEAFRAEVNGEARLVKEGGLLELVAGDRLKLLDPVGPADPTALTLDLVGFAGGSAGSPREDRGYEVDTANALLARYSILGAGEYYRVVARDSMGEMGGFHLRVLPARLDYVEIERGGEVVRLQDRGTLRATAEEAIRILRAESSVAGGEALHVNFRGYPGDPGGEDRGAVIHLGRDLLPEWAADRDGTLYEIVVSYREAPIGKVFVELVESAR